jgi:hypothetical protein
MGTRLHISVLRISSVFGLLVCGCIAPRQEPRSESYPPTFFAGREEALASAKNAFAGGSFQELEVAQRKVLVLYHYASGAFSCDAAIYLEAGGGWRLLAYYAHGSILNDSIQAVSEGDSVVLRTYQKNEILLTVAVAPRK